MASQYGHLDKTAYDNKVGIHEQTVKRLGDDPTDATIFLTVPQIQLCS